MFQLFTTVTTYLGSFFLAAVTRNAQKLIIIPFAFFYKVSVLATAGSFGGALHFFTTAFAFIIAMIMCNGFPRMDRRNNPMLKIFMAFYVYMMIVGLLGLYPFEAECSYAIALTTYGSGYFMATWAQRTEGAFRRLLVAVLIAAYVVFFYVFLHGGFSADLVGETGRAALDVDTLEEGVKFNVNYAAMTYDCILPFLVILLLLPVKNAHQNLTRILAAIAVILMSVLIIRTGSRNGALPLLACAWYFIWSTRNRRIRGKRIVFGVGVIVVLSMAVAWSMRKADRLRAFNFSSEMQLGYASKMDAITSGRWSHYERLLDKMTPIDKIVGRGFSLEPQEWTYDKESGMYIRNDRVRSLNYHSMYITIFIRTGFIGSFIFLVFVVKMIRRGLKSDNRGRMGLLLMGTWLLPGLGEAWPMDGGLALLGGFAIGLMTNNPVTNSDFYVGVKPRWMSFR